MGEKRILSKKEKGEVTFSYSWAHGGGGEEG